MNEKKQLLESSVNPLPPLTSFHSSDEIDLKELFQALWRDKVLILISTLVCFVGAAVFAFLQPNVYQASAKLVVDPDPYGFSELNGFNVGGGQTANISKSAIFYLNSTMALQDIESSSGSNIRAVSVSNDNRSGVVFVSSFSAKPENAYESVDAFVRSINSAYKSREIKQVVVAIESLETVLVSSGYKDLTSSLAKKHADLLFKRAILENPKSELIQVLAYPSLPQSHVKPKRLLITALGTLLGVMLGVAIVLVRFAFRREEVI